MEARGQVTLATLVRITRSLGLLAELETLFVPPRRTIAEMERAEIASHRQRVPCKRRHERPFHAREIKNAQSAK